MNYEIVEMTDGEITNKYVVITRDDGSYETFLADESNERYQAWVQAGGVAEVIEG